MNENYEMPILPMGSTEGICRGIYKLSSRDLGPKKPEGATVRQRGHPARIAPRPGVVGKAFRRRQQRLQRDQLQDRSTTTAASATAGTACTRPSRRGGRMSQQVLEGESGPVVAALDYVSAVGLSIAPWVTGISPLPSGEGPGVRAASGTTGLPVLRPTSSSAPTVSAAARPARSCGDSSRSMPRTSPWRRWSNWPQQGKVSARKAPGGDQDAGARSK